MMDQDREHLWFTKFGSSFENTPIACNFLLDFILPINVTIFSFILLKHEAEKDETYPMFSQAAEKGPFVCPENIHSGPT